MRYIIIVLTCLILASCHTTAYGTNHNASIMSSIFSVEF